MVKKSTVPSFKPKAATISIEEQIKSNSNDVSDPDPKKVEAFISGAESGAESSTGEENSADNKGMGRPPLPPEEKRVTFNMYLQKRLLSEVNEAAKKKGLSRNSFIVNCIVAELDRMKA